MQIMIFTPIEIEYFAIRKCLIGCQDIQFDGIHYEQGTYQGLHHNYQIILKQSGSNNLNISSTIKEALKHFTPSIFFLAGIAGGVKDVEIGDVVVANKLYGYEYGKETPENFNSRPEVVNCSIPLLDFAIKTAKNYNEVISKNDLSNHKIYFGPIASGNKVIATKSSQAFARINQYYNDTLALEMEAIGFGKTMLNFPMIKFLNVRGISDLLDNKSKTDHLGGQDLAVKNMAAFIFELLFQLNIKNILTMDLKTMTSIMVSLFGPFLKKSKTVNKITEEITEASDTTMASIWKKISPIFIEEFEEEDGLSESVEKPEVVQHALKQNIKKKDDLKSDLEKLIQKLDKKVSKKNQSSGHTTNISGTGNNTFVDVKVGGDFIQNEKQK